MSGSRGIAKVASSRILACLIISAAALPLVSAVSAVAPAAAATAPTFALTSAGPPSIGVSPDTGLPPASGAPNTGGTTNVKTTVNLTPTGFSSQDTGGFAVLQCNDDPNQPDFFFFGTQVVPVSCNIYAALSAPVPPTFQVISGNVGSGNGATCTGGPWSPSGKPPSGDTCATDGNPAAQDAANYPCPPSPTEQAKGVLCALVVVGLTGSLGANDLAAQPLEFTGEALPTMTVTGTAAGKAYPGEIATVAGSGWPITPTSGQSGATQSISGAMSVCNGAGCMTTPMTSTPPNVNNTTAALSGTMVIPATAGSGVTYPCTSNCWVQLQGTETISEEGLSGTVSAIDSAPVSIDPANEPVPAVTGVTPSGGVLAGGTTVTLAGSAFTGATAVNFCTQGSSPTCTPGTSPTVVNDDQMTVVSPAGASGPVDLLVTNATGKSATASSDVFTYQSAPSGPTVAAVSPSSGPAAGGTAVSISGSGFASGATVAFGTSAATSVVVVSASSITCTSPPGSGTVDVTVTVAGATSPATAADKFSYSSGASSVTITALTPDFGAASGGTGVVIGGTGFTGATAVDFGSVPALGFSVISDQQIVATAPAQPDGSIVQVMVTTPKGSSSATSASTFFYVGPPTVTAVAPASGNASGGNCVSSTGLFSGSGCVSLTGSDFNGAMTVQFGSVNTTVFTVVSNAEIVVSPPAGSAGQVPVTVTNPAGTSAVTSATTYTYNGIPNAPTVTGLAPTTGSQSGGTDVTITGTNFVTGATVCFGYSVTNALGHSSFVGSIAANPVVVSNSVIAVQAPPGPAGVVEVVVRTNGGTSGAAPLVGPCGGTAVPTPQDEFFYTSPAGNGYWMAGSDGGVFTFGNASYFGSTGGIDLAQPVIGIAAAPANTGYWLVASDGGIFSFGSAQYFGSCPAAGSGCTNVSAPIAAMESTPDGKGYWLVGRDGGVFAFGDATTTYQLSGGPNSLPAEGVRSLAPIVGMGLTVDGKGYWLVAADGGVFTFGDAVYFGSRSSSSGASPVVGMAPTADGNGYWLAAASGAVYPYGDAVTYGSTTSTLLSPVNTILPSVDGNGYWLFERNGAVLAFGDAPNEGSLCTGTSCLQLVRPIVGAAS